MNIRIDYKQEFQGKTLNDSYMLYNCTIDKAIKSMNKLYLDPHVFFADWEIIPE